MSLLSRLREKQTGNLATAIPAISATQPKGEAATVARIATVAVANPTSEKTAPPAKVSPGDTATASRWWLIHYPDRDPVEVACCPEARASGFGYLARWPEYPPGLFGMACGAKTRAGTPCKQKAIFRNGRCKWHGGLATGPKTEAGKEQARINGRKGGRPKKQGKVPVRVREKQPKP